MRGYVNKSENRFCKQQNAEHQDKYNDIYPDGQRPCRDFSGFTFREIKRTVKLWKLDLSALLLLITAFCLVCACFRSARVSAFGTAMLEK